MDCLNCLCGMHGSTVESSVQPGGDFPQVAIALQDDSGFPGVSGITKVFGDSRDETPGHPTIAGLRTGRQRRPNCIEQAVVVRTAKKGRSEEMVESSSRRWNISKYSSIFFQRNGRNCEMTGRCCDALLRLWTALGNSSNREFRFVSGPENAVSDGKATRSGVCRRKKAPGSSQFGKRHLCRLRFLDSKCIN